MYLFALTAEKLIISLKTPLFLILHVVMHISFFDSGFLFMANQLIMHLREVQSLLLDDSS